MDEERLSFDEIYNRFQNSDLPFEFKNEINGRFQGIAQSMYNAVHKPERMVIVDDDEDTFQLMHDQVTRLYQKYVSK